MQGDLQISSDSILWRLLVRSIQHGLFFLFVSRFSIVSFTFFTFKACLLLDLWHQQQDPFHPYLVLALRGSTPSNTIHEALGREKMAKSQLLSISNFGRTRSSPAMHCDIALCLSLRYDVFSAYLRDFDVSWYDCIIESCWIVWTVWIEDDYKNYMTLLVSEFPMHTPDQKLIARMLEFVEISQRRKRILKFSV